MTSLRFWWKLPEIKDLNGNTCRYHIALERALDKNVSVEKAMKWLESNKDICLSPSLKVHIFMSADIIDLNTDLWTEFLKKNEKQNEKL